MLDVVNAVRSFVILNGRLSFSCSLGEVCSHVAALLFKVQVAGTLGLTKGSSTSEACKWNKTFRENVSAQINLCSVKWFQ